MSSYSRGNPRRGRHLPGGAQQIAGARVVPQAAPQRQDLFFAGRRQGRDRGEPLDEALVVGDGRLRPGLLEHDLRHPDAVRIGHAPPGEIAMAAAVPGQQQAGDRRFHSMTQIHSATTAKSSGPTSQAWYSGLSGSSRICS